MAGTFQPLSKNFNIVNPDGTPTEYFIRWAQEKQIDIGQGITAEQAQKIVEDWSSERQIIAENGVTGGGPLSSDVTLSADVQAILDQISNQHGSILFKGASGWQTLPPGTSGQFLKTNGASADPSWANGGGGGGGGGFVTLPLVNPGAETGDLTGWTVTQGSFTADTSKDGVMPFSGSYMFGAGASSNCAMWQEVDVSSYASAIDAGTALILAGAMGTQTYTTPEQMEVFVEFLDSTGVMVDNRIRSYSRTDTDGDRWQNMHVFVPISPNTRKIRLWLQASRLDGTNNNVAFDNAFMSISA